MNIFEGPEAESTVTGQRLAIETRIFIPNSAFIIRVAILVLDLLTGIIFYGFAMKMFLPRLPTTIGSIIAYFAPSRAVRQFDPEKVMSCGFGRFVGVEGKAHVGIELDHLVVPVKVSSLRNGDTAPKSSWKRYLRLRKSKSKIGDTWL